MAGNSNNAKIWRDAVSASKDCPPLEVLERVMEVSSSDPKVAAHVAECPHCQSELAMLRSFESSVPTPDEGAAVAWIAAQLERKQQAPAAKASATVVPFWRSLFRVPYMAAAAALIVAMALGISLYHSSHEGGPGFSSGQIGTTFRGGIELTTPSDLSQAPDQLTWKAVAGAASYTVEIDDVTGDRIWQSTSAQSSIDVPSDVKAKLLPGKPLKWSVTAVDATGKELASGKGNFRVAVKQ